MTSDAILVIANELRAHTALTIFPYDHMTGYVMVEGHGMKIDDIQVRQKVSPEMLKADPEAGADLINNLMDHVEQLEHEVKQQP